MVAGSRTAISDPTCVPGSDRLINDPASAIIGRISTADGLS